MASKIVIFAVIATLAFSVCLASVLPAVPVAAAYVAPYASSYNAHVVNHAIAAPVAAAPLVAAAPAPLAAAYGAYSVHPYAYSAPLVLGK